LLSFFCLLNSHGGRPRCRIRPQPCSPQFVNKLVRSYRAIEGAYQVFCSLWWSWRSVQSWSPSTQPPGYRQPLSTPCTTPFFYYR
jgi:hypothetical protein